MGECLIVRRGGSGGTIDYPSGKTAMPINDIGVWQRCAGERVNYTVLSDIVANTGYFRKLIANSNAMDYFVRSTTIQAGVQNNSASAAAFDGVRRYLNPDMSGDALPYGSVSHTISGGGGMIYNAFNTGNSTGYITSSTGKFIQWAQIDNVNPMWIYKVSVKDTYGTNSQVKIQGLLENWALIDLTGTITLPKNTLVNVATLPHDKKCVGLRLVIIRQSQGANDWIYLNNLKMYGV